mgnify:CR=1 FL=1
MEPGLIQQHWQHCLLVLLQFIKEFSVFLFIFLTNSLLISCSCVYMNIKIWRSNYQHQGEINQYQTSKPVSALQYTSEYTTVKTLPSIKKLITWWYYLQFLCCKGLAPRPIYLKHDDHAYHLVQTIFRIYSCSHIVWVMHFWHVCYCIITWTLITQLKVQTNQDFCEKRQFQDLYFSFNKTNSFFLTRKLMLQDKTRE